MRVPLSTAVQRGDATDVDEWLQKRAEQFKRAKLSLEYARQAMIRAQKHAHSKEYVVGDQVKVSTSVLPVKAASTCQSKLLDRFVGPFTIVEVVNPGAYRLELPSSYVAVHDVFNEESLRPWFDRDDDRVLSTEVLPVQAHPALDRVVQVLDRKKWGRAPRNCHVLDIPAQYLVVRKDGATEWVPGRDLREAEDLRLIREFEWRFPRSHAKPCEPVSAYDVGRYEHEDAWVSDDEVDLVLDAELNARYGNRD